MLQTPDASLRFADGHVVSTGLDPVENNQQDAVAQAEFDLDPFTLAAVNAILATAPVWAQQSDGVHEWKKLVSGVASKRDNFQLRVDDFLRPFPVDPVLVIPVDVLVGKYGVFPAVVVIFADAYVLLDPFTGAATPPFKVDSPYDARSLLMPYAAEIGVPDSLLYFDAWGKETDSPPVLMGRGQIRIRCKRIMNIPGGPASHCWIEYSPPEDDRGENPNYCGGHPKCPTFANNCESNPPFGPIQTCCGLWLAPPACPEPYFPPDPGDPFDGIRTTPVYCREGTDLAAVWQCIANVMNRINGCYIPYDPFTCNSNSTAHFALEHCAGSCKYQSPPRSSRPTPGWDMRDSCRERMLDCVTRIVNQ